MTVGGNWDTGPQGVGPFGDDFPCCANVQAGYGHHAGCRNTPGWQPAGVDTEGQLVEAMPLGAWVQRAADARCQGAEPAGEIHAQDDFLTRLDELLDSTLHDDHCYIGPNDTRCVCILGKIRAVLPPCGAVQLHRASAHTTWRCLRTAHPSDPSAHYFSED